MTKEKITLTPLSLLGSETTDRLIRYMEALAKDGPVALAVRTRDDRRKELAWVDVLPTPAVKEKKDNVDPNQLTIE